MASSPGGNSNFDSGLEIKTRSVEQTLIPLVSQVSQTGKQILLSNSSRVRAHEANFHMFVASVGAELLRDQHKDREGPGSLHHDRPQTSTRCLKMIKVIT